MKIIKTLLIIIFLSNNLEAQMTIQYPVTKKHDISDIYFGEEVKDPYRWLEDDLSTETLKWVDEQADFTDNYLKKIPFIDQIKKELKDKWDYEKQSSPFKEGDYQYFYKNNGLQNQYVLYRFKGEEEPQVFLDPNTFSKDGTTSLTGISFSDNGKLLAYSISESGSDWQKAFVMDVETKKVLEGPFDIKFSGLSWKENDGFYYSSYFNDIDSNLTSLTDDHRLYYHKLGTDSKNDEIAFGSNESEKSRYVGGSVTEDNNYLVISSSLETSGNKLFIKDLNNGNIVTVVDDLESDNSVIDNVNSKFYLSTNRNAPNKKLVSFNIDNPSPENWEDVISETEHKLSISTGSNYIFAFYMVDAIDKAFQYDYEGNLVREIKLPGLGNVGGFSGKKDYEKLYFSFSNYVTSRTIYEFDPPTGEYTVYISDKVKYNRDDFISEQVFYKSKDGTKVPMIINYKKGIKLDGTNPTILYGYGGFNISLQPSFSIINLVWMEHGGIYAVPNIRGGGEYGKDWHNAGIKTKKQNVFDDFVCAAEYLINNDYTSSENLAIQGGSNGGLLVGTVMTQNPELARVALPDVGVLDMLRYHLFTSGAGWAYDYGTSEDSEEMFKYLKRYSPLHNVNKFIYPCTLITTADHDDRVVPAHSFKFAAELQSKQKGSNPILIRIERKSGHGFGVPVDKSIQKYADIFGFTFYCMGKEW